MKKEFILVLTLIVLCALSFSGIYAIEDEARIICNSAIIEKNEEQSVSLDIQNNPGIMGFKLILEYPDNLVEIKSISRGSETSGGTFVNNLNVEKGRFALMWNATSESSEDGSIAIITLLPLTDKPFAISISYSQQDTFNEEYEDVVLKCNPIISENYSQPNDTAYIENHHTTESIITDVLDQKQTDLQVELTDDEKEEILNEVNQIIEDKTELPTYTDFDSLISDYQDQLKEDLIEDISSLTEQQLDELEKAVGANENEDSVFDVIDRIGLDSRYRKYLPKSEIEIIVTEQILQVKERNKTTNIIGIGVFAILLVIVAVALFLFKYRKKRGDKE